MTVEVQEPRTRQSQASWPALALAWFCAVALGCSRPNSVADATSAADAVADAGFDVGEDLLDSEEVLAEGVADGPEIQVVDGAEVDLVDGSDHGDAITEAFGADGDADSGTDGAADVDADGADGEVALPDLPPGDVVQPAETTSTLDVGVPCTSTDIPAALTGTVEFEAAAYVYNPVVMGCGKGAPISAQVGSACCDCPPPYSCYCNGECAWLRAPDLVKPQHDGQAVWTGKWVVSLGEPYKPSYFDSATCFPVQPDGFNLQRWQPGAGQGFEIVPIPPPKLPPGQAVVLKWGSKVVIGSQASGCEFLIKNDKAPGYGPDAPVYFYDPDTNLFTAIKMPYCGKLLLAGGTLTCVSKWQSASPGQEGGLQVYNAGSGLWTLAQPPVGVAGTKWASSYPEYTVADEESVYFVGGITSAAPWPDGTPGWPGAGHILKYAIKTMQWSDIGLVPTGWDAGSVFMDHVGIVRVKDAIQAARFRLDTYKWEVGPKFSYGQYGHQEPTLTPCGLLLGSGDLGDPLGGGMAYRPVLLSSDLQWKVPPAWGYPDDAKTSRHSANFVMTDKEIFALGGMDGPPEGNFVYHQDSYRYPLSALCNKGGSK